MDIFDQFSKDVHNIFKQFDASIDKLFSSVGQEVEQSRKTKSTHKLNIKLSPNISDLDVLIERLIKLKAEVGDSAVITDLSIRLSTDVPQEQVGLLKTVEGKKVVENSLKQKLNRLFKP